MHWFKPVQLAALMGLTIVSAFAQGGSFTRIVQTGDPIPGGGTFGALVIAGNGSDGQVYFLAGDGGFNYAGLFSSSGGSPTLLANYSTVQPGGTETFTTNYPVSIDGTTIYFRGQTATTDGIYYHDSGGLHTLITSGSAAPGGGSFGSFANSPPSASNGTVAFLGATGLFVSQNGTTSRVVGRNDTVSGHAVPLTGFAANYVGNDNGNLAAIATSSQGSVLIGYTSGGAAVKLANTSTVAPGTGSTFTGFGSYGPSVDGGTVFFRGDYSGGSGVYSVAIGGGTVTKIADTNTAVPGGSGNFTSFADFTTADNGTVAFLGAYAGGNGLFLSSAGVLFRVVGTGDMIDGRTVTGASFNLDSLTGDLFAFNVSFSGGDVAIYQTSVSALSAIPEPSAYAWIAGAAALGLGWRCRTRRPATR